MTVKFPASPPAETLRYFRNKGLRPSFNHRDVWREEHAIAFTVAKAMQVDVLQSIREELDKALAKGLTLRDFQKNLTPRLQAQGWWGRKNLLDPKTGEVLSAQLGSPRRLQTIYNANLRSARAAGQWERAERTKKALPFLKYELGPSHEHRPSHAEVANKPTILPVDHPFWNKWMPPNGWGCNCRVRQITRAETERLGGESEPPQFREKTFVNKRTGARVNVPWDAEADAPAVSPEWSTNPGKLRVENARRILTEKLEAADPLIAQVAVRDLVSSQALQHFMDAPQGNFPAMVIGLEVAKAIDAGRRVAVISDFTMRKQLSQHPELTITDYRQLPAVGEKPEVIVKTTDSHVAIFHAGEDYYLAVVQAQSTRPEGLKIVSFRKTTKGDAGRIARSGEIVLGNLKD